MRIRTRGALIRILLSICLCSSELRGAQLVDHPYAGITSITRTETTPRNVSLHIIEIDLTTAGIGFKLTAPGGTLETVRQTTLDFLKQEHAQVAINAHFFLPFSSKVATRFGSITSAGRAREMQFGMKLDF